MLINEVLPLEALPNNTACSNILCYNFAQAAPAFSQLAAVLASFVFGTIILALGTPPKNKTAKDISLPLLSSFTAFVSLLITCYLFGVVAGTENLVNLFIFSLAPSLVLTLAALLLMLSIAWYFKSYEVKPQVLSGAYWLTQSVMLILAVYLIFAFIDAYVIATNEVLSTPWSNNPLLNSIIFALLGLIVLYFLPWGVALFIRQRWKVELEDNSSSISSSQFQSAGIKAFFASLCSSSQSESASSLALLISVILTIFFTIAGAVYVEFPDQHPSPQYASIIWIVLLIIVILLFFFFVPYQVGLPRTLKEEKKQTSDQELSQPTDIVQVQPPERTNLTQLQEQADAPSLQNQTGVIQPQEQIYSSQLGKQSSQPIPLIMIISIPILTSAISIIINLSLNRKNRSRT